MPDKLTITVLNDGTIKTETDRISPANHRSADAFLAELARLTGGAVIRTKRAQSHHHQGEEERTHA